MQLDKIFLTIIIPLSFAPQLTHCKSNLVRLIEDMDRHMLEMRQEMHAIFDSFVSDSPRDSALANSKPELTFQEDDHTCTISCQVKKNLETFDAKVEQNSLLIHIPQEKRNIRITVDGKLIKIETTIKNKNESDEENSRSHIMSFGSSSMIQSVRDKIDLTQAIIEYDNAVVTIILPKILSTDSKKIDVMIKKSEPKDSNTKELDNKEIEINNAK